MKKEELILLIGLLLIIVVALILNHYGFGIGNIIAISTALVSIVGLIYTNHKSDTRVEKQINKADVRLKEQLNKQEIHLEKQLDRADDRLKEQLINDDKTRVLLDIYNLLSISQKSKKALKSNPFAYLTKITRNIAIDGDELNTRDISIIINKLHIYIYLKEIRKDIYRYYYVPDKIKTPISDYINFIEDETYNISRITGHVDKKKFMEYFSTFIDRIENETPFKKDEDSETMFKLLAEVFSKNETNKYINEIYEKIVNEVGVEME